MVMLRVVHRHVALVVLADKTLGITPLLVMAALAVAVAVLAEH
jgi:hypothetical protein